MYCKMGGFNIVHVLCDLKITNIVQTRYLI